jgi:subtilisin-like proprotein convertase family protein
VIRKSLFRLAPILVSLATLRSAAGSPAVSPDGLWREIAETEIAENGWSRTVVPKAYRTFALDRAGIESLLLSAPSEEAVRFGAPAMVLTIPRPDAGFERFDVADSPIFEPKLAEEHPELRTFAGQGIDDRAATIRLDLTPEGFHAMVLTPSGSWFIDPYRNQDDRDYIVYFKADFQKEGEIPFVCSVAEPGLYEPEVAERLRARSVPSPEWSTGATLRTFRLAQAADVEYCKYFGAKTSAQCLPPVTTTINRVNGIFEKELAVHLTLIANETSILYVSTSDPYTNGNASTMLDENMTNLDSVIGNANFDIGHVFGTAGGGVATTQGVCAARVTGPPAGSAKARGVTATSNPVGDPFDIDYVAHEMGHQLGADHIFNGTTNYCASPARVAATAMEPGSGSTIMSYAGLCGAENLQSNVASYFHAKSFDQIQANLDVVASCPTTGSTGNSPPTATAGGAWTIPQNTPFQLTGSGTDPNGDTLTYCWEETDIGAASPPSTDDGTRPLFRSFTPTSTPYRIFPKLADVLGNNNVPSGIGETMPVTNRTMGFRMTARDNRTGGGGVAWATAAVAVTTAAGPFAVTAPNTAVSWTGYSRQTVTWNVANTSSAPVSCAYVKISLSTDGGNTWPTVLAAATPNDGSETITVPNTATTQARVKIEGVGNIFFDVSNVNFTITSASGQASLSVGTVTISGGDGDAWLEPGESASLWIQLVNNGTVNATSVTGTLSSGTSGLTIPSNYALWPTLNASGGTGTNATAFGVTLSSSVSCGTLLMFNLQVSFLGGTSPVTFVIPFLAGQATTTTQTFSWTGSEAIPDGSTTGVNTTVTVSGMSGVLTDLNFRFDGTSCNTTPGSTTVGLTHSWVGDIVTKLTSPASATVTIVNHAGGTNNSGKNFCNTVLDDSSGNPIQSISASGNPYSGSYAPSSPFLPFYGATPNGTWTLNVADTSSLDTGKIQAWSLVVTTSSTACSFSATSYPGYVPDSQSAGTPLTVAKSGGNLSLAWGGDCASGNDFAVYQGTIGSWYGHSSVVCTTGGTSTTSFSVPSGDRYFLIASRDSSNEGSLGKDGGGSEIPAAASPCKPRLLGGCP